MCVFESWQVSLSFNVIFFKNFQVTYTCMYTFYNVICEGGWVCMCEGELAGLCGAGM